MSVGVRTAASRGLRRLPRVTGKFLVYVRGKPSAYYFLDASGRVEHVYVGGA